MFEPDQYQLLDFGGGRKLERFGTEVLDRPSPAAEDASITEPDLWGSATARFDLAKGGKGQWHDAALGLPSAREKPWSVRHGSSQLLMELRSSGNIGIFPEQANNWDWIADRVGHCRDTLDGRRPRVLNLFAYTGGASLTAGAAGAEVAHVDSSGPTVAWAKRNAEASGSSDLPVRWLVEDALRFTARERRRGSFYDGIIADPPTYGHGPKGRPFKFNQHLDELMESCAALLDPIHTSSQFLLFSCHAPGFGTTEAATAIERALPSPLDARLTSRGLVLECADGRELPAGVSARWSVDGR